MNEYFKQIDALRCYAVMGVAFFHLAPVNETDPNFFFLFYKYVPGVPLFFCISGFLITNILVSNSGGKISQLLINFYKRRFLRIFPIYYLTIFVLFILNLSNYREYFIYDFFYLSNIKQAIDGNFGGSVAPHFWSLAVEEQFYLFWPLVVLSFRKSKYHLFCATVLFLTGTLAFMIFDNPFFMARTIGCLSYLGSGALLAVIWQYRKSLLIKIEGYLSYILLAFTLFVLFNSLFLFSIPFKVNLFISILIIPVIILKFSFGFKSNLIRLIVENKVILYLGKISYGLYVYHLLSIFPLLILLKGLNINYENMEWLMFVLKFMLTIGLSILSWELFEKRILKLKDKFAYK